MCIRVVLFIVVSTFSQLSGAAEEAGGHLFANGTEKTVSLDGKGLSLNELLFEFISSRYGDDLSLRKIEYSALLDPIHHLGSLPLTSLSPFMANSVVRRSSFRFENIEYVECLTIFSILKNREGVAIDVSDCEDRFLIPNLENKEPSRLISLRGQLSGYSGSLTPEGAIPIRAVGDSWKVLPVPIYAEAESHRPNNF